MVLRQRDDTHCKKRRRLLPFNAVLSLLFMFRNSNTCGFSQHVSKKNEPTYEHRRKLAISLGPPSVAKRFPADNKFRARVSTGAHREVIHI